MRTYEAVRFPALSKGASKESLIENKDLTLAFHGTVFHHAVAICINGFTRAQPRDEERSVMQELHCELFALVSVVAVLRADEHTTAAIVQR